MYLITGSEGFIGRVLLKELRRQGIKCRTPSRDEADLLKPETLLRVTEGADITIHLAGMTHTFNKDMYMEVNAVGTMNLINACRINRVKKFVFISTRAIAPGGGPYSLSKIQAEGSVRHSSLTYTILRLSEVYGGDRAKGVERLVDIIKKYPVVPVIGNGTYKLQPVYVKDAVSAMISASIHAKADFKTYNISGPDVLTYNELVKLICESMRVKRQIIHVPVPLALAAAYAGRYLFKKAAIYPDQIPRLVSPKEESIQMAVEDFGFKPIGIREGIKKILSGAIND